MTYKGFNTSNRKLNLIWDKTIANQNNLNLSQNQYEKLFKENGVFKTTKLIFDIGWTYVTPVFSSRSKTPTKNSLVNNRVTLSISEDIKRFPTALLPYLSLDVQWKGLPDGKFTSSAARPLVSIENSWWEIKGDGSLIFQDYISAGNDVVDAYNFFLQSDIDNGTILENKTKKAWNAQVIYTSGGDTFKVEGGIDRITVTDTLGVGCDGNNNTDVYFTNPYNVSGDYEPYMSINSLDNTSYSFQAQKTENRYVNLPPCTLQETVVGESIKTGSWSDGATVSFRSFGDSVVSRKWKLIDGEYVLQDSGSNYVVDISSTNLISMNIYTQGYILFYDTGFSTVVSANSSGSLSNLPSTEVYSAITVKKNPDNFPEITTSLESDTRNSFRQLGFFEKETFNDGLATYECRFSVDANYFSPATVLGSETVDDFDDEWTFSGSYTRTTTSHTTKTLDIYQSERPDIQGRARMILINPFVYLQKNRYENL